MSSSTASETLVKIIDFGVGMFFSLAQADSFSIARTSLLASQGDEDRSRLITNPYWRSPESWVGMPWGPPADIWSFGSIVWSAMLPSFATTTNLFSDWLAAYGTWCEALPTYGWT